MLRIGLDIDDTISDFYNDYFKRFGKNKSNEEITWNVQNVLKYDKDWWINRPIINMPDFSPVLYCTKRVNPKAWTREFLQNNNLSTNCIEETIPIYQIYIQQGRKSKVIKGLIDVFIDDSITNFIEMNLNGVPCLLMNSDYNQDWGPIGRIYSLEYEEISDTFELFKNTIGNNFRELL